MVGGLRLLVVLLVGGCGCGGGGGGGVTVIIPGHRTAGTTIQLNYGNTQAPPNRCVDGT